MDGAPTEVPDRDPRRLGHHAQPFPRHLRGVKQDGWPPCPGKLWQRDYYERIIRNDRELDALRAYIAANPTRWTEDPNHPTRPADPS